ncbi:MAG: hypothetical protein OXH16_18550 [Gemmatimonadetes bacterium]|nr:hypothetical protein [Gemmatimonadota bacterium]
MNTRRYQLRFSGLRENKGRIKVATLQCSLDALVKTAECATRLMVTGEGSGRGPRPGWLNAALDFTITGGELGSTIFEIEAPQLDETAYVRFAQQNFWREETIMQDTAVDLAALSIQEAQETTSSGDYFDRAVLSAILRFRQPTVNANICYHLIPQESDYGEFTLDASVCNRIENRLKSLPPSRAFIISGWIEEIKQDGGRFFLELGDGRKMFGRLQSDQLDVEQLRPLWGKRATVQGMVHFKANGQPRLIEAYRLRPYQDRDAIFEELPSTEMPKSRGLTRRQEKQARSFNVLSLCGTWPGNEPVEELLAQLD